MPVYHENCEVNPHIADWSGLEDVVAFLDVANPHGYTADQIRSMAEHEWAKGGFKPTYLGTGGWYVSIVCTDYGKWIALVSVQGYTALHYMTRKEPKS